MRIPSVTVIMMCLANRDHTFYPSNTEDYLTGLLTKFTLFLDGKVQQRASNMQDIAKTIYRNHGVKGLFTGLLPRIFKVAPACAIMIATFEYGKQFFQKYNTQKYKEKMQRYISLCFFSVLNVLCTCVTNRSINIFNLKSKSIP